MDGHVIGSVQQEFHCWLCKPNETLAIRCWRSCLSSATTIVVIELSCHRVSAVGCVFFIFLKGRKFFKNNFIWVGEKHTLLQALVCAVACVACKCVCFCVSAFVVIFHLLALNNIQQYLNLRLCDNIQGR